MAKIIITIEDNEITGGVKVVSNPTFETMAMMDRSGAGLTSAHGYALAAINKIREVSKAQGPNKVLIPKVKV